MARWDDIDGFTTQMAKIDLTRDLAPRKKYKNHRNSRGHLRYPFKVGGGRNPSDFLLKSDFYTCHADLHAPVIFGLRLDFVVLDVDITTWLTKSPMTRPELRSVCDLGFTHSDQYCVDRSFHYHPCFELLVLGGFLSGWIVVFALLWEPWRSS